jgi:hypothetical protein
MVSMSQSKPRARSLSRPIKLSRVENSPIIQVLLHVCFSVPLCAFLSVAFPAAACFYCRCVLFRAAVPPGCYSVTSS